MTAQGFCSYFVHMDEQPQTFGDAAARGMLFRVECACGRSEYFVAKDLVRVWGKMRKISQHRFSCKKCQPPRVTATALPIDLDRIPKGFVMRLKAGGYHGDPEWVRERFRG